MQFKDLKDGYPIYLFDRSSLSVQTGRVTSVTTPHASSKPGATLANLGLVVDVVVNIDGKSFSYEVKDNSENAYIDTTLLTSNVDIVVNEIKAIKNNSEETIKSIDKHKANIEKCTALLSEFDPIYREKKETDDKINSLAQTVANLAAIVEKLNDKIK